MSDRSTATVPTTCLALLLLAGACTETLDAGASLPVDGRNPAILINDNGRDNWQGEYALLLSNRDGPKLVGLVVASSPTWPDLAANVDGWKELVAAAWSSGLKVPDSIIQSKATPLVRPTNDDIDSTQPNNSDGAQFIVEASRNFSLPGRPVVLMTGSPLTDVADAYLLDHSVTDRVVVVASLGLTTASGADMGIPNGNTDAWATAIVAQKFRYVQVSAFYDHYDQLNDVPDARVAQLPGNAFGKWMAAKQPGIFSWQPAADQVAVAAVGIPGFAARVRRVSPAAGTDAGASATTSLYPSPGARGWLVAKCDGQVAATRLWEMLLDPNTFVHSGSVH